MSLGLILFSGDKLISDLSFTPFGSGCYLAFFPHYFISPIVSLGQKFMNFMVLVFSLSVYFMASVLLLFILIYFFFQVSLFFFLLLVKPQMVICGN